MGAFISASPVRAQDSSQLGFVLHEMTIKKKNEDFNTFLSIYAPI